MGSQILFVASIDVKTRPIFVNKFFSQFTVKDLVEDRICEVLLIFYMYI